MVARLIVLVMIGLAAAVPRAYAQAPAAERARIAVIPFENTTTWWGYELGRTAASQLTIKLVNSLAFSMVERSRIEESLKELHLGQTGVIAKDTAAQLGKQLGAEYLITGSLTSFSIDTIKIGYKGMGGSRTKAVSAMNVRVINVTTGEIVAAAEATGDVDLAKGAQGLGAEVGQVSATSAWNPTLADKAIAPTIVKLSAALVDQKARIPALGALALAQLASKPPSIAAIATDGSVYIDQGQNTGITVGKRYNVLRVIDTIKDKEGNVLDQVTKPSGVIEVTQVLSKSSVCKVIEGKPGAKDILQ